MSNFTQPAEDLSSRTKEYVDLRLDELKLAAAKGLSITASKLVGLLLITGVATNLVIVLSFGRHRLLDSHPEAGLPVQEHLRPGVRQPVLQRRRR